jgi:hypothetical protein
MYQSEYVMKKSNKLDANALQLTSVQLKITCTSSTKIADLIFGWYR